MKSKRPSVIVPILLSLLLCVISVATTCALSGCYVKGDFDTSDPSVKEQQ